MAERQHFSPDNFRPEERSNPFRKLYAGKRKAILSLLAGGPRLRILDVGGGFGRLSGPLSEHHDVTLCDLSLDMLRGAQARWPKLEKMVRVDALSLPFATEEFDLVLSCDLLPHVPDLGAGVRELARVGKKGGRIWFDTTNGSPWWVLGYPTYVRWRPWRLARVLLRRGVLVGWQDIVRHDLASEVQEAIARAGLQLQERRNFGPIWTPMWHLWCTTKPA